MSEHTWIVEVNFGNHLTQFHPCLRANYHTRGAAERRAEELQNSAGANGTGNQYRVAKYVREEPGQ